MPQEKSSVDNSISPTGDRASPDAISARRRAELANGYLRQGDVLTKLDIDQNTLTALRRARKILSVWHPTESRYV